MKTNQQRLLLERKYFAFVIVRCNKFWVLDEKSGITFTMHIATVLHLNICEQTVSSYRVLELLEQTSK